MARKRRLPSSLKSLIDVRTRADGDLERYGRLLKEIKAAMKAARKDRDAADRVIKRIEPRIVPEQFKPVQTFGKYGKRGSLTEAVRSLLKDSAPEWVSTEEIAITVKAKFGLDFATPAQHSKWVDGSLVRELRTLVENGLVERGHKRSTVEGGRWRWKSDAALSLDHLKEQVEAAGGSVRECDADPE